MWTSYIFHFFTKILTSTPMKKFNIFLHNICRDVQHSISVLDNVKMTAKLISTKVSFKITIRKRHVHIDTRLPWKWKQYLYLEIREDERSKIIFLPSYQLVTRLIFSEQKWNKFINELWHINLYMNISISNWHNSIFDPHENEVFTLFQFLTRLLTSSHFNLIST